MPSTLGIVASGYVFPVVSGGTLTSSGNYYYRTFTSNGSLTVSNGTLSADIFLVAGGGGGGSGAGGGGGAGGIYLSPSERILASGSYSIVIGAGGTSGAGGAIPTKGDSTYISGIGLYILVEGGGYGGQWGRSSGSGGSGGGGGSWGGYRGSSVYNSSTGPYYGRNGANAVPYNASAPVYVFAEGGGGGAMEEGQYGIAYPNAGYGRGGDGGDGLTLSWNSTTYGGGGGGGGSYYVPNLPRAIGGTGGGGYGQTKELPSTAGSVNTGGGGGGGYGGISLDESGKSGGSGIVIIRYAKANVGG